MWHLIVFITMIALCGVYRRKWPKPGESTLQSPSLSAWTFLRLCIWTDLVSINHTAANQAYYFIKFPKLMWHQIKWCFSLQRLQSKSFSHPTQITSALANYYRSEFLYGFHVRGSPPNHYVTFYMIHFLVQIWMKIWRPIHRLLLRWTLHFCPSVFSVFLSHEWQHLTNENVVVRQKRRHSWFRPSGTIKKCRARLRIWLPPSKYVTL